MATLYYWTKWPQHVSLLMRPMGGGEIYVSHLPDQDAPQTQERGRRTGLPGILVSYPVTIIRFPKLAGVTLDADLAHWGEPEAVLALSNLVDDDDMAEEARLFLNARATIDPGEQGYDSDYSYYQLAEGAPAPTQAQDPNWQAQRRQCVTTTNRLLYHGVSPVMQYLRDMLGDTPRRPRNDNQPWTPQDVYEFCLEHLVEDV